MTERIAVAVDFSPESERALVEAIALARTVGGEVEMIHASGGVDLDDESQGVRDLIEQVNRETREKLASLHARFDGQGAPLSQTLVDGFVAEGIVDTAVEHGCSTIVVGTHGRTGLRRFFLGSVAEKVARTSKCDVLISRGTRPNRGYQRILVPTDFSRSAELALVRAVALAGPDAEIELVHVWQLPAAVTTHYAPLPAQSDAAKRLARRLAEDARELAEPLLQEHRREGVGIEFTAVGGSASQAILDRAGGCDLIAMGTHGRKGITRFFLGSVAERTIRHAPCSVLVTHAQTEKENS